RRVVRRNQRRTAHHAGPASGKKVEKLLSNVVTCHGDLLSNGLNTIVVQWVADPSSSRASRSRISAGGACGLSLTCAIPGQECRRRFHLRGNHTAGNNGRTRVMGSNRNIPGPTFGCFQRWRRNGFAIGQRKYRNRKND